MRYRGGTVVTQQSEGEGVAYIVADQTNFALARHEQRLPRVQARRLVLHQGELRFWR